MSQVCILTDSTAQFPVHIFPGSELINIIPFHVSLESQPDLEEVDLKPIHLPSDAPNRDGFQLCPPSVDEFCQMFISLGYRYREIVVILASGRLTKALENAHKAVEIARSSASIYLVDSLTTAVGLGILVERAASAAQQGESGVQISRLVRGLTPHVYTVFCLYNLSYLARSGFLDPAQAIIGDMLEVVPFFVLENGTLTPVQKVRGSRQLVDLLYEFVMEFNDVKHVALIQGVPPFEQEARLLRERLSGTYRSNIISEHTLGIALAGLFGPHSLGLVVLESFEDAE